MKEKFLFTVKDITEIGIFVALAIVLDLTFFKIRLGQNGGSISLAMLPLFIIAYRKNFFKTFIACGIVYGLIDCLIDGYGIITYPFDYLLGFGCISAANLYKNHIFKNSSDSKILPILFLFLSVTLVFILRVLFSTISGIIFYDMNFISSMIYQLTYIGPSSLAIFIILLLLFKPLCLINKRYQN